jgi:hypothetical protein
MRLSGLGDRSDPAVPGAPLFVTEIATPSMTGNSLLVASAAGARGRTVAIADPRLRTIWRQQGIRPIQLLAGMRDERDVLRRASDEVHQTAGIITRRIPQMPLANVDLRPAAIAALRRWLPRSVPWLAAEAKAAEQVVECAQPAAVVVTSDQHRIGRLLTQISHRRRIPVVVLQHGFPQAPIGYLPVVADRVAVWSATARDWFVAHGTDASRLAVTGSPQLDILARADRDAARRALDATLPMTPGQRLLLALSPTASHVNVGMVEMALESLRKLPTAILMVKLHPGYRDWGAVDAAVRAHRTLGGRVRLVHRQPVAPYLLWAQATLMHSSTVAIESLAAGTPVLRIGSGDPTVSESMDVFAHVGIPSANTVQEVVNWCNQAMTVDTIRESFRDLIGPTDGRSAERVLDLLPSLQMAG